VAGTGSRQLRVVSDTWPLASLVSVATKAFGMVARISAL
jgi:hypothetical protein